MTTVAVRERPIIFSGPMVRAILDGRKTQTRRVVRGIQSPEMADRFMVAADGSGDIKFVHDLSASTAMSVSEWLRCPYGQPGDHLWVRETWGLPPSYDPARHGDLKSKPTIGPVCYGADYTSVRGGLRPAWDGAKWRSPIHMPRWASRLTLEITDVRVERLQAISEADAAAEGIDPVPCEAASIVFGTYKARFRFRDGFRSAWDSINGNRAPWDSNPFVWALTFRKVDA
jgi:hypothetical protein